MNDDQQVIEALQQHPHTSRTLDPAEVIAGARRRRSRNRLATGLASAAVAGVAVTGVVAAGGLGGSTGGGPAVQPPVAGSGGPSWTASSEPTVAPPSGQSSIPVTPRVVGKWVPGGPVGAKPIGTIPVRGKVEIHGGYWFETKGTKWCVTATDEMLGTLYEPFGCRGTVGNSNITPGLSSMQGHGRIHSSVFRGDAHRVLYTSGDRYYEAKLYRLAAVPGWMVAVVEFPASEDQKSRTAMPRDDQAVFGYDKAGKLIGRFPDAKDGGPTTDPLHAG